MELQTGIEKLEAQIAALEKKLYGDDPDFRMITYKAWKVVDKDGKIRIAEVTFDDGTVKLPTEDRNPK
jgi:hypothetical protein